MAGAAALRDSAHGQIRQVTDVEISLNLGRRAGTPDICPTSARVASLAEIAVEACLCPDADGRLKRAGSNTDTGIRRIRDKRDRYHLPLRNFVAKEAHAVETIRSALPAGAKFLAERVAHSLKGAASTLGVNVLASAAARAEAVLGQDLPTSRWRAEHTVAVSFNSCRGSARCATSAGVRCPRPGGLATTAHPVEAASRER